MSNNTLQESPCLKTKTPRCLLRLPLVLRYRRRLPLLVLRYRRRHPPLAPRYRRLPLPREPRYRPRHPPLAPRYHPHRLHRLPGLRFRRLPATTRLSMQLLLLPPTRRLSLPRAHLTRVNPRPRPTRAKLGR